MQRGAAQRISERLRAGDDRPYPRPRDRGLWPQCRGDSGFRRARRDARGDRRLRRRQPRAVRGREPAWPRRDRVRSPSGAGGAAEDGGARRSQPRGRSFRASAISAPRASSSWRSSRSIARCARQASGTARKGPDLHRRARPRGARDRRRRRAADRAQPRLCRQGARDHAGAPPPRACGACSTSPARTDRRGPTIWALSSARASTRADGSATRRSACGS